MSGKNALPIEDHPEKWVEERIKDFIGSEVSRLTLDGQVIFDEPLVGFSRGDDPLFRGYKRVMGKFHYTPLEWMKLVLGEKAPRYLRPLRWTDYTQGEGNTLWKRRHKSSGEANPAALSRERKLLPLLSRGNMHGVCPPLSCADYHGEGA